MPNTIFLFDPGMKYDMFFVSFTQSCVIQIIYSPAVHLIWNYYNYFIDFRWSTMRLEEHVTWAVVTAL